MTGAGSNGDPLRVEGVQTRYGRRTVLHGVDLTARPGEICGLIGLNGVGKTTLIKSIVGLADVFAGSIRIFGRDHVDPRSRAALAFLPEQFLPSAYLTGWEFLKLTVASYGLGLDREAAAGLAGDLGLDADVLKRRVTAYSKGMGQKLGLVGTFLTGRQLLILDEPMSGLDPRARAQLKDRLIAARSAGQCVFLSSHILAEIDELCDRVVVIHAGRIVYEGTPAALRAKAGEATLERAFLAAIDRFEAAS